MCGTEATFGGGWCSAVQALVPTGDGNIFGGGPVPIERVAPAVGIEGVVNEKGVVVAVGDGVIGADVAPGPGAAQAFGAQRDALWPKSVITWLILSVVFLGLSVQFVSPTRRWRLRRGPRASTRTAP